MQEADLRENLEGYRLSFFSKKFVVIASMVLVLPGCVFLGLGLWQYLEARSYVKTSVSTQGRIVSLKTVSSGSGVMFSPVFEFSDETGKRYLKESDTASYPAKYRAGETVEVLYQPDNPIDAKISSNFSVWGKATILLLIGGLFVFFGLAGSIFIIVIARFIINRFSQRILKT